MTPEQMAEIRERVAKALDGPWAVGPSPLYLGVSQQRMDGKWRLEEPVTIRSAAHTEEVATFWNYLMSPSANADFVAHAREDVPALLAYIDELHAALNPLAGAGEGLPADFERVQVWLDGEDVRDAMRLLRRSGVREEENGADD